MCSSVNPRVTPESGLTCSLEVVDREFGEFSRLATSSTVMARFTRFSSTPVVRTGNAVHYEASNALAGDIYTRRVTRDRWMGRSAQII